MIFLPEYWITVEELKGMTPEEMKEALRDQRDYLLNTLK